MLKRIARIKEEIRSPFALALIADFLFLVIVVIMIVVIVVLVEGTKMMKPRQPRRQRHQLDIGIQPPSFVGINHRQSRIAQLFISLVLNFENCAAAIQA